MSDAPQVPQTIIIKQKGHFFRNCLFVALVGIVLIVVVIVLVANGAKKAIDSSNNTVHHVEYIANGTVKADITYTTDGSTSMSTSNGTALPWDKKLNIKGDLFSVYQLSVQNTGDMNNTDTVTCEIKVDGKSVQKGEGKGFGAIASCDYTK